MVSNLTTPKSLTTMCLHHSFVWVAVSAVKDKHIYAQSNQAKRAEPIMEGQMWPEERALLHKTVVALRPKISLEIGTWKGGGSTFQIATAISEYGILHTCEPDKSLHRTAKDTYEVELNNKYPVVLHNEFSHIVIQKLISDGLIPDFVLMDGPEDPNICLNDLRYLEDVMLPGSIVSFHDWDTDTRVDDLISTKSALVRPYIEMNPRWELIDYITRPISVGFSVWKRTDYKSPVSQ